ncbi:ankyrin repeat-containing protein NPR4-like [Syzygium oleosum]|uniref:ankyrin repeat-containing protein NPR4-like n=1 Tax=Syzygium oleosum TaxID=219896 RepID=UPI0024BAE9A2|nr:ankyrin repeat-containing protein NPR4-like [Syzygium oleosum]
MRTPDRVIMIAERLYAMICEMQLESVTKWSPRCVYPDVSGAAFLLQRELQWFKVVEDKGFPFLKHIRSNGSRKTLWEALLVQRQKLLKEARQWMKDTSSSCTLIGTLITTVAFAAAFAVPEVNDGSMGTSIFPKKGSFMVFAVANALTFLSSVTSTLMFLAILTSRYAEEDFLHSLPKKMILGLTFLFLSLAFMIVAFSSALITILSERFKWIYIPITLLASFPVILFAILQLPLYVEMVESTYWARLYRPLNPKKIWK